MSYVSDAMTLGLPTLTAMVLTGMACTVVERVISRVLVTPAFFGKGAYKYATVAVCPPRRLIDTLSFLQGSQQVSHQLVTVCLIQKNNRSGEIEPAFLTDAELAHLTEIPGCSDLSVLSYGDQLIEHSVRSKAQSVTVVDVPGNFSTFSLRVEALSLKIVLMISAAGVVGHQLAIRTIHGVKILMVSPTQYGLAARFAKRVFDIVVSLIAIVVNPPIMLAVAIVIKCDGSGLVLYRQERIGLCSGPFKIFKFRSKGLDTDRHDTDVVAASGQTMETRFKVKDDSYVTRAGKFIRKTSLDELLQFFNSLISNMSVAGLRPQRHYEGDGYDLSYATRLLLESDITGPWQMPGHSDLSKKGGQQLDVAYVQNWSVLGDIVYLFRTVVWYYTLTAHINTPYV